MADVFISYSREDNDFVRKLHGALAKVNRDSWIDWQNIPPTAEWLREIYAGIEAADNFVFVMSPNSVASATCLKELDYAVNNNKRLIPLFLRTVPYSAIPEALARCRAAPKSRTNSVRCKFRVLKDRKTISSCT